VYLFNQSKTKLVFISVLFISLLGALLNLLGLDFASQSVSLGSEKIASGIFTADEQFYALRGALHHVILEWTAVSIAFLAALMSFVHYNKRGDVTVPIIGLALLCAGLTDAFHTLAATRIISANSPNSDFIPFTWAFSRIFNSVILIVGVLVNLWLAQLQNGFSGSNINKPATKLLFAIGFVFIATAILAVSIAASSTDLPQTTFADAIVTRPFDVLPMALFLLAGALIWSWHQKRASIFKISLLMALIPEVATQIHMSFGSTELFDNHFNIAHALKIFAYFCILSGVFLDLVDKSSNQNLNNELQENQIGNWEREFDSNAGMVKLGKAHRSQLVTIPLVVFSLAIGVSSLVGGFFYADSRAILEKKALSELEIKAEIVEPFFQNLYETVFSDVQFISGTPPIQGIIRSKIDNESSEQQLWQKRLEAIFETFLKNKPRYLQIRYIGIANGGKELVKATRTYGGISIIPTSRLQSKGQSNYLKNTLKLMPKEVYFSRIELNRENGKVSYPLQRVLRVATPIYNELSGEIFGLVIINVNYGYFIDEIKEKGLENVDFYLANTDGDYIYHPDSTKAFGFDLGKRYQMQLDFPVLVEPIRSNSQQFTYNPALTEANANLETSYQDGLVYRRLSLEHFGEQHKIRLLLREDSQTLNEQLKQLRDRSFILGLGLGVLALALAVLASRKITSPLLQTIDGIRYYQLSGKLPHLPLDAKDEIGLLARNFHNMMIMQQKKDKEIDEQKAALDQHALVAITDIKGTIIFANEKFTDLSGFNQDEIIGQNHRILNSGFHDKAFFKQMYHTIGKGKVWNAEVCNRAKDGHLYWLDTTILPLLNNKGKPERYIAVRTDITERKKVEKDLLIEKEKAEAAVKSKSEFLASMSHEIRTPMNGVLGMLGLLKKSDLRLEQERRLDLALGSAESLLNLINDVLDFSKIDAGKMDLEIIDFDLRSMLGDFSETMSLETNPKGIELILDVTGVEQSLLRGDPGRIRQIITNLTGNAIKFCDEGEIVITVKTKELANNKIQLKCSVSDTGIGIPQDKLDDLWSVFTQVDASTTRKYGGTGLGLSIVKRLCELMNGSISVISEKGSGSCFTIEIELKRSQNSIRVMPEFDISELSILIVDDNATNRKVLKEQLSYWGANVEQAASGDQAISLCQKYSTLAELRMFDLAILDMHMPKMDGVQLAKKIRANEKFDSIKLVMMTSIEMERDDKRYTDIDLSDFFPKPATTTDLLDALKLVDEDTLKDENIKNIKRKIHRVKKQIWTKGGTMEWPQNCRLLLVEDNRVNQLVASGVLKSFGLHFDIANDGVEAIATIQNAVNDVPYTLVLMDCQMPEMDGYEATGEIRRGRAGDEMKKIPIVAMTANAMQGDKQKCLDAGMDDYLTKPINQEKLFNTLKKWIN